jgi:acetyltransferase-like isoleucine patch superfamily enzyme
MSAQIAPPPGLWSDGELPANVRLGPGTLVTGSGAFRRFLADGDDALVIGASCTIDGVQFSLGKNARLRIGDFCYFTNAVILAELELVIGNHVMIGWNATIADSDFHPIAPTERIADALALSPLGAGRPRPPVACRPVVIEDDVWIGPNATILKGVRLGAGCFVEPGALVARDVPAGARVAGNPARPVEEP